MAAMTAVKKVHAEARERKQPNEPIADEKVRPMLGDKQESCHGKKTDEHHADCRPPEGLRPGMFVVIHELSNPVVTEPTRIDAVAFESEYGLAISGALICVNAQFR